MVAKKITKDVLALPRDERLELFQTILESLVRDQTSLPLTDSQREELDRRNKDFLRNPEDGTSWGHVKSVIQQILRSHKPQKIQ